MDRGQYIYVIARGGGGESFPCPLNYDIFSLKKGYEYLKLKQNYYVHVKGFMRGVFRGKG